MEWVQGGLLWLKRSRESPGVVLVVQRRVGGAVVRNQLRRRLRRIARLSGLDCRGLVVLARPGASSARYADLALEFEALGAQMARRHAR